jgi:hypothetical protein
LRIVVVATLKSERGQLARDPLVAQRRFSRESEDQLADLTADRRSPRARAVG